MIYILYYIYPIINQYSMIVNPPNREILHTLQEANILIKHCEKSIMNPEFGTYLRAGQCHKLIPPTS